VFAAIRIAGKANDSSRSDIQLQIRLQKKSFENRRLPFRKTFAQACLLKYWQSPSEGRKNSETKKVKKP